jgi:hypothetical protein
MTNEKGNKGGWTHYTIYKYFSAKVSALQNSLDKAVIAQKESAAVATEAQSAYNARSNEFRSALDDANKQNMPRTEADGKFKATDEKINRLEITVTEKNEQQRDEVATLRDESRKEIAALREESRKEISALRDRIGIDIQSLRESRERNVGQDTQQTKSTSRDQWVIMFIVALPAVAFVILEIVRLATGK